MPNFEFGFPIIYTDYDTIEVEADSYYEAFQLAYEKVKYRGDEPISPDDLELLNGDKD